MIQVIPVVVDASAMLEYLLGGPRSDAYERIITALEVELHAPALFDVEVAAGLRRALNTGAMSERRAAEALQDHLDLDIHRHGHQRLLSRALQLRDNFSVYDATYVALAERLDGVLVTADERLARAVRAHLPLSVEP